MRQRGAHDFVSALGADYLVEQLKRTKCKRTHIGDAVAAAGL
jgi:hypothetical protein